MIRLNSDCYTPVVSANCQLDALDWGRRNFVSSLWSAAQPLLIDVAQIHRAAVLEMTAAHGRGGTGERSASKRGALQTLRFAGEQT